MNLTNLRKLWSFTHTIPEPLFDMLATRQGDRTTIECKSLGCLIGHSFALEKNPEKYRIKDSDQYSFVVWADDFYKLENDQWDFLFSPVWANIDNTLEGARNRITYLGKNEGKLPDDWFEKVQDRKLFYN